MQYDGAACFLPGLAVMACRLPASCFFVALLHAASAGMHYATRGLLHCRLELPCHSASLDEISSRARGKHAGRRRDRCRTHLLHAVLLRRIPLRRVLLRSSPGLGPTYRCPDSVFRLQRLMGTAEPQVEASCTTTHQTAEHQAPGPRLRTHKIRSECRCIESVPATSIPEAPACTTTASWILNV